MQRPGSMVLHTENRLGASPTSSQPSLTCCAAERPEEKRKEAARKVSNKVPALVMLLKPLHVEAIAAPWRCTATRAALQLASCMRLRGAQAVQAGNVIGKRPMHDYRAAGGAHACRALWAGAARTTLIC